MPARYLRLRVRRVDERGAVAIIVALSMVALVVASAMVIDFGAARLDRQGNKAAADAAVTAGMQGLDGDTGEIYSLRGVCAALDYLKANEPALSSLAWTDCTDATKLDMVCNPASPTGPIVRQFAASANGYEVLIQSPYNLTDPPSFPEETSKPALAADRGDPALKGCDQIAVIVTESRKPGLGSLATSSDLVTTVRSVGRVAVSAGDIAPALLLLERNDCGVLTVGSAGSPSRIQVAASPPMPATIHSDSTATGADCGNGPNQQLFQGKQANGAVAYGTGTLSGLITSVATANGRPANIVADDPSNVYGTTSVYPATGGTTTPIQGRRQVTRKLIDRRYLPGVTSSVISAYGQWNLNHSSPTGYTRYGCPSSSDMTAMAGMTASQSVYIDCPGSGITLTGSIGAGRIYFHGFIKGGALAMPNATQVYIDNTNDSGSRDNANAISLNNNQAFCVRATSCDTANPTTGQCSTTPTGIPASRAQLIIRRGAIAGNGTDSLLRLCSTTVIMEGGQLGSGTSASPGGCLPTSYGIAPTATPCGPSTAGDGPISTQGATDWTAPNAYGDMVAAGLTTAQQQTLWDGGEDLALWTETFGDGPTYKMAGGGNLHVAGVFMVPNAFPFSISGGGLQDLTNAQFITRSFAVDGGAILKMAVDPYNAVPLPELNPFTLVR